MVNYKFYIKISIIVIFLVLVSIFLSQKILKAQGGDVMGLKLSSSAFDNGQDIPQKYTCEGEDISPPLNWENIPEGTKSFVLISDDPDAPMGTWVHWVIYDIPVGVSGLEEGVFTDEVLDDGTKQGINNFRRIGYGGPCPPPGTPHHYYFKLYALDTELNLSAGAKKSEIENAMKDHILSKTELIGLYSR